MVTQRAPGLLREDGHAKALGSSKHLGVWMISPCFTWKSTFSVDNYYNKVTFRYIKKGISIACKKMMTFPGTFVALFLIRFQHLARVCQAWGFCELLDTWRYGDFVGKKNIELEKDVDKWNCLDRLHAFKPIFVPGCPKSCRRSSICWSLWSLEESKFDCEENAQPRLEIRYPSHRTASSPLSHGHRVRKTR